MSTRALALFRCDASASIGAGHVLRCLALADALADAGWRIAFVVSRDTGPTVPALTESGYAVRVLSDDDFGVTTLRAEASDGADLLVIDHYGCDVGFEKSCRAFARKIVVFDDMTGRNHNCDFLLDAAAFSADQYAARVPARAKVLTGPAFAMIRRPFLEARLAALTRRDGRPVRNILVSCGATDPSNATAIVLDVLAEVTPDIDVIVVLSSHAAHIGAVRQRLRRNARLVLDANNMADLIRDADIAIGASGLTAFERAALGLPSILITVSDNQRGVAQLLTQAGAAVDGGRLDSNTSSRLRPLISSLVTDGAVRVRVAQAASKLVDGRGEIRTMLEVLDDGKAKNGASVKLRQAEADDEDWLLVLQRQPNTRQHFLNPEAPAADEHHRWMQRTLADPARTLLIIEQQGTSVGMVRLDRVTNCQFPRRYDISIAVDAAFNGHGIASAALGLVRRFKPAAILAADIVASNTASKELFLRAGFTRTRADHYESLPS